MLSKFHSPSHCPGSLEATSSDSLVSEWLLRFSDVHANATQFVKALFIYFPFNTLVQMRSSTRFETSKWNGGDKGYHPAKNRPLQKATVFWGNWVYLVCFILTPFCYIYKHKVLQLIWFFFSCCSEIDHLQSTSTTRLHPIIILQIHFQTGEWFRL